MMQRKYVCGRTLTVDYPGLKATSSNFIHRMTEISPINAKIFLSPLAAQTSPTIITTRQPQTQPQFSTPKSQSPLKSSHTRSRNRSPNSFRSFETNLFCFFASGKDSVKVAHNQRLAVGVERRQEKGQENQIRASRPSTSPAAAKTWTTSTTRRRFYRNGVVKDAGLG
jgi:hypothetical protein